MTKATLKQPKQLEFPLLVNLNAKDHQSRNQVENQEVLISNDVGTRSHQSLEASAEDLNIYRSIGEGFLRQFN